MEVHFNDVFYKNNIIDIRSSLDFYEENIIGSINVPRIILLSNPSMYLNQYDDYYLVCDKGKVSLSCCKVLNALGYKCYSIIGGIESVDDIYKNKV